MASVESVDELQERVARSVDERLGPILQEVNRLNELLNTKVVERTLLEEQLLALRTQGGNAYVRENRNLHTGHFTNATEFVLEVNNANCQGDKMQLLSFYITLQTPKQGFLESCKKLQIGISPVPKFQDPNF